MRLNYQKNEPECETDSEKNRIAKALEQCRYSKTDAAQLLGVSRKTLFNRMKK